MRCSASGCGNISARRVALAINCDFARIVVARRITGAANNYVAWYIGTLVIALTIFDDLLWVVCACVITGSAFDLMAGNICTGSVTLTVLDNLLRIVIAAEIALTTNDNLGR